MNLNLYDKYDIDEDLAEEGVWLPLDYFPGSEVKLARLKNPKAQAVYRKLEKPYRGQIQQGELDPDVEEELLNKTLAKAVVKDWKGDAFENDQGELAECSEDNVLQLLEDLEEFRSEILRKCQNQENYRKQQVEEDTKN